MSKIALTDWPFHQDVRCAVEYLAAHGIKVKPATMAGWRVDGIGPKFRKDGPRVVYKRDALDAFIEERLGQEVSSSAEARAAAEVRAAAA
jgi:hypothetical protein